ncbi:MAPEG family protein [Limnohabitans sp. Rim47]|uniref:MAPEG family protein n=1 Tax=Limnohabitans sp. Rim47 TaxID=1100721 RepID=UPI0002DD11E6|nr:MAPEG family protein [Limnohabitans sp. Rim47]
MVISYACVLIAGLMPVFCAGIAKAGAKGYDNHDPRAWLAQQSGFRARANAAQANCLEAFPFFAVGLVLALLTGVDPFVVDSLAVLFVAARVAYVACYLADKALFRSIFWAVGYFSVIAFYVLAMQNLQLN